MVEKKVFPFSFIFTHNKDDESWAQYRLDTLMAGDPDRAMDLVRTVNRAPLDKAGDEMAALEALKRDGGDTTPFAAWDYGYYQPLLERERYGVDATVVNERIELVQQVVDDTDEQRQPAIDHRP